MVKVIQNFKLINLLNSQKKMSKNSSDTITSTNPSEHINSQSKLKLNKIWNELQQNLPSIDFEDGQVKLRLIINFNILKLIILFMLKGIRCEWQ